MSVTETFIQTFMSVSLIKNFQKLDESCRLREGVLSNWQVDTVHRMGLVAGTRHSGNWSSPSSGEITKHTRLNYRSALCNAGITNPGERAHSGTRNGIHVAGEEYVISQGKRRAAKLYPAVNYTPNWHTQVLLPVNGMLRTVVVISVVSPTSFPSSSSILWTLTTSL